MRWQQQLAAVKVVQQLALYRLRYLLKLCGPPCHRQCQSTSRWQPGPTALHKARAQLHPLQGALTHALALSVHMRPGLASTVDLLDTAQDGSEVLSV